METKTFRTNLNCDSCIASVTPFLNADSTIKSWKVDITDERKPLTMVGESIKQEQISNLVKKAGFEVYDEILKSQATVKTPAEQVSFIQTYRPLLLILGYLLGVIALQAFKSGDFSTHSLMNHFMGGFFIVFSFFKLLDLKGFAESYQSYDILAKRSLIYAYAYPFIELSLGVSYIIGAQPFLTNLLTLGVMGISSIGVIQSVMKKQKIRCACLGTMFNLPMSTVTLIEDLLMVFMAIASLLF